jgi:DNA-binding CsgD family transcriptional regulator
VERYQVLDQLSLLVDKSLVVTDDSRGRTRYRLLETVRQYAQEKLGESREADAVRSRHRDYFTALAAAVDAPAGTNYEQRLEQAEMEIDNLRAAFGWSCENSDTALALTLASSLQPLWITRGRAREGRAWFDTVFTDEVAQDADVPAAERARSLADIAVLDTFFGAADSLNRAQQALVLARDIEEPAVLARALTACGLTAAYNAELAGEYFAEALELARELDDRWRLSQILTMQAHAAIAAGDVIAAGVAAEEGRDLADAMGDRSTSRHCRMCLGIAQVNRGELAGAVAQFRAVVAEAEAAHDGVIAAMCLAHQGTALARQGETSAARTVADASIESASEFGDLTASVSYFALANAALAAGDVGTAQDATAAAWEHGSLLSGYAAHLRPIIAQAAQASGDLTAARSWADEAVATATGWIVIYALTVRARVAIAQGEPDQAERDAHDALAHAAEVEAYLHIPDILECLATLAGETGSHREAARLLGAAEAIRLRTSMVRFKIYAAGFEASAAALRDALGEKDFESAWAEGAALSAEEAIAYAQRGRGQRKRPTSGWASLTPTELDVVRLVSEGLTNNDIATRLFISPRTVQTHLTHVYTKLGLTSRVQLVQEAARHA